MRPHLELLAALRLQGDGVRRDLGHACRASADVPLADRPVHEPRPNGRGSSSGSASSPSYMAGKRRAAWRSTTTWAR